jgi:DNA transposition AAA+ family ATPase
MKNNWLYRSMEQDAQRVEVWMPKTDNEKELAEFIAKIESFITRTGLSKNAVARLIDIGETRFNQFMNNKYPGPIDIIVEKLTNLVNTYERRSHRVKEPEYVHTNTARKIFSAIRRTESYCQLRDGRIIVIIGDAGSGKTKCLQEYNRRNPNSVYVELKDSMGTQGLFSAVAKAIDVDSGGGVNGLAQRISDNLCSRDLTVILDEASILDAHRLNMLRQTISQSGCTLVLAGNEHLLSTLRQTSTRRGYESLDQFKSRVLCVMNLNMMAGTGQNGGGTTTEDINAMFDYGIRLTSTAVRDLKTIIKSPKTGKMRFCSTIINTIYNSVEAKTGQLKEIDSDLIRMTIADLGHEGEDQILSILSLGKSETEQEDQKAKTA